jgi:hypothetical protein
VKRRSLDAQVRGAAAKSALSLDAKELKVWL